MVLKNSKHQLTVTGPDADYSSRPGEKQRKRVKKIRKQFTNFRLLYSNINHLKSKAVSLENIVKDTKPTAVAVVETKLGKDEEFKINGYKPYPMNRDENGGGLLLMVREELANITVVVEKRDDVGEIMWLVMSNGRHNIRIGIVYAPQESKTNLTKLKTMYKGITEQVEEAKLKNQSLLLVGDFNCKIGKTLDGNSEELTKGGKMLNNLVLKQNLKILNSSRKCKGLWTREEGEKKSVLDYVLVDANDEELVKKITIDEEREITPKHRVDDRDVYTDHNSILLDMDWTVRYKQGQKTRICMSSERKEEFLRKTNQGNLLELCKSEKDPLQKFSEWNTMVMKIVEETFYKKKAKRKERKEIRLLKNKKKGIKSKIGVTAGKEKEYHLKRKKLIDRHIDNFRAQSNADRTECLARKIKCESGFDGNIFWEYMRKIKGRKVEAPTAMKNEDGKLTEDPDEILQIYKNFYNKLLSEKPCKTDEGRKIEKLVDQFIETLERKGLRDGIAPFTEDEYSQAKRELKNGKAPDLQGWRYEFIKHGGEDLEVSTLHMINELVTNFLIPLEWLEMIIKSIGKKKGDTRSMDSKRGLFLTNILSKMVEKMIKNRRKSTIESSLSPFQCGGTRKRGPGDNLFILNSAIEESRAEKKDLYLLFADLEKCFDQLWLKDCIKEINQAGMPAGEALYLYYMNKEVKAIVDTPIGKTESFPLKEIVRQGTVSAVDLCGVSTDKINKIGDEAEEFTISGVKIKHPVFVDDMLGLGNKSMIEGMQPKLQFLEETKRFTVNNEKGKTEIMEMIFDGKKNERDKPRVTVKRGDVGYTDKYKYMGDQYDKTGKNMSKITKKMEKAKYIASEVKRQGCYTKVGHADTSIRMLLLELVVIPTLLYNTETWINITKEEFRAVDQAHYKVLIKVFEQKKNTPYYGILMETGYWPYSYVIIYKRLMFYHHLIHSDQRRIARKILINQMNGWGKGYTWYMGVEEWLEKLDLENCEEEVMKIQKSKWKRDVKRKLGRWIKKEMEDKKLEMKKLRYTDGNGKQDYIEKFPMVKVRKIMKVRLHMTELKANFRGKYTDDVCPACEREEETTEHVIRCTEYQRMTGHQLDDGREIMEMMRDTKWLLQAADDYERIEEAREWILGTKTNFIK